MKQRHTRTGDGWKPAAPGATGGADVDTSPIDAFLASKPYSALVSYGEITTTVRAETEAELAEAVRVEHARLSGSATTPPDLRTEASKIAAEQAVAASKRRAKRA